MNFIIIIADAATAFADAYFARIVLKSIVQDEKNLIRSRVLFYIVLPILIFTTCRLISMPHIRLTVCGISIFIVTLFVYRSGIILKTFAVLLLVAVIQVGDIFVYGVVFSILPNYQNMVAEYPLWYLTGVTVFYLYIAIVIIVFSLLPYKSRNKLPAMQGVLLTIMPLTATATIILLLDYINSLGIYSPAAYLVPSMFFILLLLFEVV